jgi:hypothetical protein
MKDEDYKKRSFKKFLTITKLKTSTDKKPKTSTDKQTKISTDKQTKISTVKQTKISTVKKTKTSTDKKTKTSTDKKTKTSTDKKTKISTDKKTKISTDKKTIIEKSSCMNGHLFHPLNNKCPNVCQYHNISDSEIKSCIKIKKHDNKKSVSFSNKKHIKTIPNREMLRNNNYRSPLNLLF